MGFITRSKEIKEFLIVFVVAFFAGSATPAYALPTFNTANVKTYYASLTSSGWRNDATDVDTAGILTMFSRHFTLSSDDSTDFITLASIDPDFKSLYSLNARRVANQKDSGRTIDFSGVSITHNGNANTTYTLHTDVVLLSPPPVIGCSFWITKDKD